MPPKQIDHIEFRFYGPRNFPVATGVIPPILLADFEELLAAVQQTYPQHTYETLTRYVWARGLAALRKGVLMRAYPDPNKLPKML